MRLAGRYELMEHLAEGGMAEVWLATMHGDAGFTRRVAIKQLFARQNDPSFERMFLDEARLTSRLHHQGIVSILDFGVEAGRPFQVLELVDGFDASRLARWGQEQGKPLPVGLALSICAQVGHALHFAHGAADDAGAALNIVHRDVSPQNVLVSRAGDVKLSDFGIAFAEGRLEKTVGGIARGKPAYMAPEQAVRGAMDARTDVFGLGCVLHALVTGESALRDENALVDLLAGVELTLSPSLPEEVREVVAKATRRHKAERFQTAEEMALACGALVPRFLDGDARTQLAQWVRALTPVQQPRVVQTPLAATPVLATPEPKRRSAAPVMLAVTALAGLGAAAWWFNTAPAVSDDVAPSTNVTTARVVETPPAPSEPVDAGAPTPTTSVEPTRPPIARTPAPVKTPTPREVAKPAVLAVGGERFLRGEVRVDGKSVGTAPGRFELTVGEHRVEVTLPSGEVVGPRAVVLTSQHTGLAPLYLLE